MNKSTELMFFFVKYDVLVFVPLHVFVVYRNISASPIVNCSRVGLYKARPTACLTHFHQRRTSVVCVLEDMVTSFPLCQYSFCKSSFIPRCLFHFFCNCKLQLHDSFLGVFFFLIHFFFFSSRHLRLSFCCFY